MPRYWFTYASDWRDAPMAYWTHDDVPPPVAVSHRGFPILHVDSQGFEFVFSSYAQVVECIDVLGQPRLPTTRNLSASRSGGVGPNSHWLSRLPATIKSPASRLRAAADLQRVVEARSADEAFWKQGSGPGPGR
jgi:hypothetical protein